MAEPDRKPEPAETDPEKLEKLLEIELMQKRAAWQQARVRRGNLRLLSVLFLVVIVALALFVFVMYFSPARMQELKSHATPSASP